ncbi:MAG: secondary thiamine-phosphate synthase enzyme YjbQ [Acidimicrobiia bacterium]
MQLLGASLRTVHLEVTAPARLGLVDITYDVGRIVEDAGVSEGVAWVFCQHTTCGILINEYEDGLTEDLGHRISGLVSDGYFAHDDLSRRTQNLQGPNEPPNGSAHVRQMLFGATSQVVPIFKRELALGMWQRILFLELDDPRTRNILVTVLGA